MSAGGLDEADVPVMPVQRAAVPQARRDQPAVTDWDLAVVAGQLARLPRSVHAIAARCVCGRPVVVRTAPRLEDGSPFPTSYYLTHPAANAAISTLEAGGVMVRMQEQVEANPQVAQAYRAAHEAYLRDREQLGHVEQIAGISAGGMPTRVKCLHALVAHALAAGPGVNPCGDAALVMLEAVWSPARCACGGQGGLGGAAQSMGE